MMEKYGDKVRKDVADFKYELEADSPGVTEQIERGIGISANTKSF